MADLSRKTASIYINHAAAEEALKKLQQQADKMSASIKKGEAAGKDMVNEIKKLNTTKDQIAQVQRQIDSGLKPSFNQLQSLVAKTRSELRKMSESDPGFKQKAKDLEKYNTEMRRLGTQIGAVKKESGGLGSLLGGALPILGAAAIGGGLISFLKLAKEEALNAELQLGKLQQSLKNIGREDALDRLAGKAEKMADRFRYLDSADVVSVFDKLVSYGRLTEAQMDQLTPVIINFAVKSKMSLDDSASTIIKALQGQGRALKDYGVDITDAKTESERLAMVMGQLGDKVNGAAEAFGETTQGKIATTQQTIKNLAAEIGDGLLPIIRSLLEEVAGMVRGLQEMATEGLGGVLTRVKDGFFALVTGGTKALDELNAKRNAIDPLLQMDNVAESYATRQGQKSIEEQKKLADAYKNVFIQSRKELAAFRDSADKEDAEKEAKLVAQVQQKGKIFLATQRALNDTIETEKRKAATKIGGIDDKSIKDGEAKRLAALRKAAEDARRLQAIWADFVDRIYDSSSLNQDDPVLMAFKRVKDVAKKDIAIAKEMLDKRIIDYQQYSDAIVRIEEIRLKSMQDIGKRYKIDFGDSSFQPGVTKPTGPVAVDNTKAIAEMRKGQLVLSQRMGADQARLFRNNMAAEELKSLQQTGRKKLDAQLNLLEFQKAAELANKDLTENEKLLIEEKYREKRKEAEVNFQIQLAETILEVANQVADIMNVFSAAQNAADENRLAENQRIYDEDKNKLDRQLRQKVISIKEYDRQVRALDEKKRKEDAAIKRKQFERDKQAQIVQAIMAGASAVINAMKAAPPLNFIFAGLATAMVAAQIATISSQKTPQFAKGGLLDGPAHNQGGMPVLNRYGRKVAEVEGGEAILSKKTVKNNWALVNELLNSSMYGGGARLTPYSQSRSGYRPLNYSGLSSSMNNIRHFEKGGIFPGGGTAFSQDPIMQEISLTLRSLNETTYHLNQVIINSNDLSVSLSEKLSQPIKSYTLLSDFNATQDLMNRIKKETTITRDKN